MKRPLRHIIEEFIGSIPLTFNVISRSYDIVDDSTTITVDNVLHLNTRMEVNGHKVIGIYSDTVFIVKGEYLLDTVTYPMPYYFAGSPLSVLQELSTRKKPEDRFPFIYLYEVIEEIFHNRLDSHIERDSDISLYFLDECDYKWDTELNNIKFYEQVIDGMFRLANYFVELASDSEMFARIDRFSIKTYAKFGAFKFVEIKNNLFKNSMDNTVFNDELSGVELRLTLPVYKEINCN